MRDTQLPDQDDQGLNTQPDPAITHNASETAQKHNTWGLPRPGGEVFKSNDNPKIYISNWHNALISGAQGVIGSFPVNLFKAVRNTINQGNTDSPMLNEDEIKDLKKDRHGLTFPPLVRQQTAQAITDDFDASQFREQILSHRQPGIEAEAVSFASELTGSIISDPVSMLVGSKAGEVADSLIGVNRVPFLNARASMIAKISAKSAAEAGAFGASQSLSEQIKNVSEGKDFNAWDIGTTIGSYMAIGGVMGPLGKGVSKVLGKVVDPIRRRFKDSVNEFMDSRSAMSQEASDDVVQTSVNMMNNGKDPDVTFPVKKGVVDEIKRYHQEIRDRGINPDEVRQWLDNFNEQLPDVKLKNTQDIDTIRKNIATSGTSKKLESQLEKSELDRLGLQLQEQAMQQHRFMLDNPDLEITQDDIDKFARHNNISETDFADGIQSKETFDTMSNPVNNLEKHLTDTFPEERKKELLESRQLNSSQKNTLEDIRSKPERMSVLSDALKKFTDCVVGSE